MAPTLGLEDVYFMLGWAKGRCQVYGDGEQSGDPVKEPPNSDFVPFDSVEPVLMGDPDPVQQGHRVVEKAPRVDEQVQGQTSTTPAPDPRRVVTDAERKLEYDRQMPSTRHCWP